METFSPSGINFNYENHNQEHLPTPSKDQRSPGRLAKKQNSLRQMRQFRMTSVGFLPGSKHLLGKTMSSCRGREEPVILVMKLLSDIIKTCPYEPYQLLANVRLWPRPFYQLPEFYSDHAQNQLFFLDVLGHVHLCVRSCLCLPAV